MSDVELEEAETKVELTVGQKLRAARQKRHWEIVDIAGELKLEQRLIEAIENGHADQLPEPVFTAGYLRSYARLVGLPSDEIVAEYVESETRDLPPIKGDISDLPDKYRKVAEALPKSFSISTRGHLSPSSKKLVGVVATGVAVVGLTIWIISESFNSDMTTQVVHVDAKKLELPEAEQVFTESLQSKEDIAEKTSIAEFSSKDNIAIAAMETAKRNDQRTSAIASVTEPSTVENKVKIDDKVVQQLAVIQGLKSNLMLHFSHDSWVDIRDATGKRLIRRLGIAGGTRKITGISPFQVLLGYGPGVTIEYDGKQYEFEKKEGDRVARFTLDVEELEAQARFAEFGEE